MRSGKNMLKSRISLHVCSSWKSLIPTKKTWNLPPAHNYNSNFQTLFSAQIPNITAKNAKSHILLLSGTLSGCYFEVKPYVNILNPVVIITAIFGCVYVFLYKIINNKNTKQKLTQQRQLAQSRVTRDRNSLRSELRLSLYYTWFLRETEHVRLHLFQVAIKHRVLSIT